MKFASILASTLTLAVIAVAAPTPVEAVAPAPASQGLEALIGQGTNNIGGVLSIFVVELGNGETTGTFEYQSSGGYVYGGTLFDLFVEGDDAYASGQITYSDGPPVGLGISFKVTDNGSPWWGAVDSHSGFWFTPGPVPGGVSGNPGFRGFIDTFPSFDVTDGNILVKG